MKVRETINRVLGGERLGTTIQGNRGGLILRETEDQKNLLCRVLIRTNFTKMVHRGYIVRKWFYVKTGLNLTAF